MVLFPLLNGSPFAVPGASSFTDFKAMERAFASKLITPAQLKNAVCVELNKLLAPIREKFQSPALKDLAKKAYPAEQAAPTPAPVVKPTPEPTPTEWLLLLDPKSPAATKCHLACTVGGLKVKVVTKAPPLAAAPPGVPMLSSTDGLVVLFGATAICAYAAAAAKFESNPASDSWLEWEEASSPAIEALFTALSKKADASHPAGEAALAALDGAIKAQGGLTKAGKLTSADVSIFGSVLPGFRKNGLVKVEKYPSLNGWFGKMARAHPALMAAWTAANALPVKKAAGGEAAASGGSAVASKAKYQGNLMKYVELVVEEALLATFPSAMEGEKVMVTPSRPMKGKASASHYQCNNAMALFKKIGKGGDFNAPNDVALALADAISSVEAFEEVSAAAGYVNITIAKTWVQKELSKSVSTGIVFPPQKKQKCIVDFSSPNIAKEMHVGHLRSTIIGESICRVLDWLGHDVSRVNHVGDWGTQFGMLITHLKDEFPNFLNERPPIGDLQEFYKASKKRFDVDEEFKKRAYTAVVSLQQGAAAELEGKPACEEVLGWRILCDISRAEFDKIYTRLDINGLVEKGESFYNPYLPKTVEDLLSAKVAKEEATDKGTCVIAEDLLITEPHLHACAKQVKIEGIDEKSSAKDIKSLLKDYNGLSNVKVAKDKDMNGKVTGGSSAVVDFKTRADAEAAMSAWKGSEKMVWNNTPPPLMVQKSDGGYGYDSTDMAAIRYRIDEEKADWIIYVTDVGQSLHFQLVFDAARKAKWLNPEKVRVDHIGFGLVLSPDGGKFKTRSGETVRLVDLLDEAKDRAIKVIGESNKDDNLTPEEIIAAGPIMGYGAVKYADLSNVLDKDYTFDFDKMLNFKGNTAVYLLYAYARVQSIFRKCNVVGADRVTFAKKCVLPAVAEPEEWDIAMQLSRFGEMVDVLVLDLHPHHITDFAYKLAEFLQKFCGSKNCNVLRCEPEVQQARLSLLHLANTTLGQCMKLVGIDTLEKL